MEITGERSVVEHKRGFDGSTRDKVRLVKEVVALANAAGGEIQYGVDPTGVVVGVPQSTVTRLDASRVGGYLRSYIRDQVIDVEVEVRTIGQATVVVIQVAPTAEPPVVMERDGNFDDGNGQESLFKRGDVMVRDFTQACPAAPKDFARWREMARRAGELAAYELMRSFVQRPEGTVAVFAPPDTPAQRLRTAAAQYRAEPRNLLGAHDLVAFAVTTDELDMSEDLVRELLVQSALRKKATLWWWISEISPEPDWLAGQLRAVTEARDRDVSDAGKPVLELSALACRDAFDDIRLRLASHPRYAHFREAATAYETPEAVDSALARRTTAWRGSASREGCLDLLRELLAGEIGDRRLTRRLADCTLARLLNDRAAPT